MTAYRTNKEQSTMAQSTKHRIHMVVLQNRARSSRNTKRLNKYAIKGQVHELRPHVKAVKVIVIPQVESTANHDRMGPTLPLALHRELPAHLEPLG